MLLFLVLFALWLLLNGQVTLELILIGAAVSGAVWLFCYRTLGYRPQRERVLLRRLPRYAHYAAALAAEIFKANLTVMRAILSGRPCRPCHPARAPAAAGGGLAHAACELHHAHARYRDRRGGG